MGTCALNQSFDAEALYRDYCKKGSNIWEWVENIRVPVFRIVVGDRNAVSGLLMESAWGQMFRLRRVTWKSTPSNQGCLLLVWPDFVGFLHSGLAPWARRHPPSMAGGGSRGIHAARPTERDLRSACTQVAFYGVWTFCVGRSKAKASRLKPVPLTARGALVGLALAGNRPFLLTARAAFSRTRFSRAEACVTTTHFTECTRWF